MATKLEPDYPSSPTNDDSDGEDPDSTETSHQYTVSATPSSNNNVEHILKRLQSTGALVKKPKQEYHCYTCNEDFEDWEELENHLIQHISQPTVLLDKLSSEDEDIPPSGDENWSDEEENALPAKGTPQKIDISQILKKSGISIKKQNAETENSPDSALSKLSGLGFTIKKNATPIKKEPEDPPKNSIIQKIGSLGGLKMTLKSAGDNNSFKVINGLKDFQASDEEGSGKEENREEKDGESEEKGDEEGSAAENDSADEESDDRKGFNEVREIPTQISNTLKNLQGKIVAKHEPKTSVKAGPTKLPVKETPKFPSRPAIKQTPKRGANEPVIFKESPQTIEQHSSVKVQTPVKAPTPTPDRRSSRQSSHSSVENVTVKQEVVTNDHNQSNIPLFSGQIKTERMSPPKENISTPIIAKVKSEPDTTNASQISQPFVSILSTSNSTTPLLPVTKTEDTGPTIIEINGDSNDEDDDCCVVSATPAPDIKPIVPKTEGISTSYPPPLYPTSQPDYTSSAPGVLSSRMTGATSLAKQHNFNWNAPDSKPAIDMLEKSADDIFESLLSNSTKKEGISLSEASEYISLDTLGPQHSCDICNVRFTDISLLEEHRRMTGHSRSIVPSSSASSLMPYNPTSILSSLLPVKQLADHVGKLTSIDGGGSGFTHQQNVMINIQAYPGASGVIAPPPLYTYPPGQNMPSNYQQGSNNMFHSATGQQVPGSYGGQQGYMGEQGYGQFQSNMSNAGYPGTTPTNPFSVANVQYTSASPLQSMQQAVYGQSPNGLSNPTGQMGPPGVPYVPTSSPSSSMKPSPNSGIRIQNVQTFPPGQLAPGSAELHAHLTTPGQMVGGQMPPPSQIRMANSAVSGPRPRLPGIRGQRPSIRPGIQVHGQIRGSKPGIRMPMKRPSNMMGGGTMKKRPNMLLPDRHDNEDCQVMAMQKQRDGLPMIQSVQGAKDKINLGSQISITKKTVNKEANAMANVLASRGISIKQKQKSRSPTPERPVPHIPNLGAGVSIKHTSKSNNFSIPEAKVGSGMLSCKVCKKIFMNHNSLAVHMSNVHPQVEIPSYKCDECPASYPKSFQLQHHKRVFHNMSGPNKELGLPVVDLSQEENLKKLSNLGIYNFIPLANREQVGGCFGIPVISVHSMQNGKTSSLQGLGADGLLSLGPLKPLPN